MGYRALRVINEDRVAPGQGFGTHPHRDMEIISYMLEGALRHEDSMGTGSVINVGDVQRMSAGTGVLHSERNASDTKPAHFLQIWLMPERNRLPPSYEQRTFPLKDRRGRLTLVASRDSRDGSIAVHQDVDLFSAILDPGVSTSVTSMKPGRHALDSGRARRRDPQRRSAACRRRRVRDRRSRARSRRLDRRGSAAVRSRLKRSSFGRRRANPLDADSDVAIWRPRSISTSRRCSRTVLVANPSVCRPTRHSSVHVSPSSVVSSATTPCCGNETSALTSSDSRRGRCGKWPAMRRSRDSPRNRSRMRDGESVGCRSGVAENSASALHARQNASAVCRARSLPLCHTTDGFAPRAAASAAPRSACASPRGDNGRRESSS